MTSDRVVSVEQNVMLLFYPYGNVYPDGRICWGTISTDQLKVGDPGGISRLFWGSGFNRDLVMRHPTIWERKINDGLGRYSPEEIFAITSNPAWTQGMMGKWGLVFPTVPLPTGECWGEEYQVGVLPRVLGEASWSE